MRTTRLSLLEEIRQTRSSERWDEFFDDYGELLQRWLVAQQIPPADADDLQQETMLAVLNELPRFQHSGRPGAFRKWLKQILVNRMRRLWEQKRNQKTSSNLAEFADVLEDETSRVSIAFHREHEQHVIQQLLTKAASHFSVRRVQLFTELVLDGVPIDELEQKYDLSRGAIRVQQHRIVTWLRETGQGMVDL